MLARWRSLLGTRSLVALYLWLDLRKQGLGQYEEAERKAEATSDLEERICNEITKSVETQKSEVPPAPAAGRSL